MNRIPRPNLRLPSAFPLVSVPLPGAGRVGAWLFTTLLDHPGTQTCCYWLLVAVPPE
jgi:hypothetical protein